LGKRIDEMVSPSVTDKIGSKDLDPKMGEISHQIGGDLFKKFFPPRDEDQSFYGRSQLAGIFKT
jgi:hypothetical protein